MSQQIVPFGQTGDGQKVEQVTLSNGVITCKVLTFGAAVQSLLIPDRSGKPVDVVLGYDTLQEYETQSAYFGATIGRHANRIGGSRFTLNGKEYLLPANERTNQLHGGPVGYSHRVWEIDSVQADSLTLRLESADGEGGYPGNLTVRLTYRLTGSALQIHYSAVSDQDTVCNLTNHSYFNLNGHDSGSAMQQEIAIAAQAYTPSDAESIPYGTIVPVEGTPFDLRSFTPIGAHIDEDDLQLRQAGGYDHNFALDGEAGQLRPVAFARASESGISMEVRTTLPGMQFYAANHVPEGRKGKGGCQYGPRHAFCLETQFFPDSVNKPAFASAVLRAGDTYDHITEYAFSGC